LPTAINGHTPKRRCSKGGGKSYNRIYLENKDAPIEGNSAKLTISLRAFHLDNQNYSTPNSNIIEIRWTNLNLNQDRQDNRPLVSFLEQVLADFFA